MTGWDFPVLGGASGWTCVSDIHNTSPLTGNLFSSCPDSFSPSFWQGANTGRDDSPTSTCQTKWTTRLLRRRFFFFFRAACCQKNDRAKKEKTSSSPTSTFQSRWKKRNKNEAPAVHSCSCRPHTRLKHSCSLCLGDGMNHSNYAIVMLLPSWLTGVNASTGMCISENQSTCAGRGRVWTLRRFQPPARWMFPPLRGPAPFQRSDSNRQAPRSCGRNLALHISLTYGEIEKSLTKLNSRLTLAET